MTEPLTWHLVPKEGFLPLRLGMTAAQVADLGVMGPLETRQTDFLGDEQHFHSLGVPHMTYRKDQIIYMAVNRHVVRVLFAGLDVLAAPPLDVLQAFETANGAAPVLQSGTLKFLNLDLTALGYYDPEQDAVFAPGSDQDDRLVGLHAPGTLPLSRRQPMQELSFL